MIDNEIASLQQPGGSTEQSSTRRGHVLKIDDDIASLQQPGGSTEQSLTGHGQHVLKIDKSMTLLSVNSQGGAPNKVRPDADNMVWSGSSSRDVGFGYSESSVTITVGEDAGAAAPEKKEVPIWMQKSTVEGVPMLDGGDSLVCMWGGSQKTWAVDFLFVLIKNSVQFCSRWYLCGREIPYALHPVSQEFSQYSL